LFSFIAQQGAAVGQGPGGSPEATRRAFNKRFLLDLAEDWQQHGREVFKRRLGGSPSTAVIFSVGPAPIHWPPAACIADCEWPRRRAAEERYELAPPHSITSSAWSGRPPFA
jgi:hypothetical protein